MRKTTNFSEKKLKRAFTLVEMLVVIFVIALLISLVIPAVIAVRESARKTSCVANLHQIGLAVANYQSSTGVFPAAVNGAKGFSSFSMLVNELDGSSVYNSINFSLSNRDVANITVSAKHISVLMCPADGNGRIQQSTNYTCLVGYGFQLAESHEGIFGIKPALATAPSDVTDGLSATAMISEWLLGSVEQTGLKAKAAYIIKPPLLKSGQFDTFVNRCRGFVPNTLKDIWDRKGESWIKAGLGLSLYNHNITPNENSCLNGTLVREGSWTASSNHPGLVHVLFGDGHTQAIRDSITLQIWRALSTKNGGETVSDSL